MFEIESKAWIGIWDESFGDDLPAKHDEAAYCWLKDRARTGDLFFVDSDEAFLQHRIEVLVDENLPETFGPHLAPTGGGFRLNAPTGRLVLGAIPRNGARERIEVEPATYVLTPYGQEFDPGLYDAQLRSRVGEANLRFRERVDQIGSVGCLAIVISLVFFAIPATRPWWSWTLPLVLLPLWLHVVGKRLPRYRRVEGEIRRFAREIPSLVLQLRRSAAASELPGGNWTNR